MEVEEEDDLEFLHKWEWVVELQTSMLISMLHSIIVFSIRLGGVE
jgi:hypothetical protein